MSKIETSSQDMNDTETQEVPNNKVRDAITFIINLVSLCVERGGYNINDVVKIKESIEDFTNKNSTEESQKNSIINLIGYIQQAQAKGKLKLEEAYQAHLYVEFFTSNT